MIQSIDCEQGVDTSGLRYKKLTTFGLDMADILSMQELEVLQKDLDENTAAWLWVSTALVTKYQRLGDGGESEDDMDETD
jgi:hypothetical protein